MTKTTISEAAAALGRIGGSKKTPAQQRARKKNAAYAASIRKGQRSGPDCKRCHQPWPEHDKHPCR